MADVTYRACWVDDYSALALDCDLMVHCGHASSYLKVVRKCIL